MRFQFIDDHQQAFPITLMCRVLEVSRSGYYDWRKREPSARKMADEVLLALIRLHHKKSRGYYGSPRIYQVLQKEGVRCGRKRVARLMREAGLRARQKRRYKVTTQSNHHLPVAPNLLDQTFTAERPDAIWLSDITYIATAEGWLYLAVVLDLYSRMIVGWSMQPALARHLPLATLQMALRQRQPKAGWLHHSDQGSQYASADYQQLLADHGARVSMSRRGNCYDQALVESFFSTLKMECVQNVVFQTREQAKAALFDYIEVFYNRQRLHSSLGYLSPTEYELAPLVA
jgi:transposase InsO family protein